MLGYSMSRPRALLETNWWSTFSKWSIFKSGPFNQTLPGGVCVCVCVCVKAWMVLGTFLSTSKFFLGGSDCLPGVFVQDDNVDWTWLDNPEVQISIHFHLLGTNAPGSYIVVGKTI